MNTPLYDGDLVVNGKSRTKCKHYKQLFTETVLDYSRAKIATINNQPYAVGAISRFNNNSDQLHKKAKAAAKELGLKAPCHNPYLNTAIQLVEWVHCLEESISLMEKILKDGLDEKKIVTSSWPKRSEAGKIKYKPNTGIACVEVPRAPYSTSILPTTAAISPRLTASFPPTRIWEIWKRICVNWCPSL